MEEDYNPTRKEVVREMVNGVKEYFNGDNLKNFGSSLKETGKNFLYATGGISIFMYILPTTIRKIKDSRNLSKEKIQFNAADHIGFSTGLLSGFALDVAQIIGYSYAVKNDYSEALLIPVATNVVSGVFEMYKNARQRVLKKHKSKNLEATLEIIEPVRD